MFFGNELINALKNIFLSFVAKSTSLGILVLPLEITLAGSDPNINESVDRKALSNALASILFNSLTSLKLIFFNFLTWVGLSFSCALAPLMIALTKGLISLGFDLINLSSRINLQSQLSEPE